MSYPTFRVLEWVTNLFTKKETKKPFPKPTATPGVSSDSRPSSTPTPETLPSFEALPDTDLLNWILSRTPGNGERKIAEEVYTKRAQTLEQLDRGLWVLANPQERIKLLEQRFNLRQNSEDSLVRSKLTKLTPDLISWAEENRVPLEVLGICLDTQKIAKRVIQKLIDKSIKDFRPDFFDPGRATQLPKDIMSEVKTMQSINAERLMMNIGGMAMLMNYETGGFANIGSGAALAEINQEVFGNAIKQMEEIAQRTSKITGLKFVAKNIPGSLWTPGNKSGGAIGPQFMPGAALEMMNLFESVGETLNIFHPSWAVIASWVFLARSQQVGRNKEGKNLYREGYLVGDESIAASLREYTIGKWNPDQKQIDTVIGAANRFSNRFENQVQLATIR